MSEGQLNLARKWRAQRFDQVIGQDLAIKMVKNSLYRGQLFPVYLLWGQHGTGKTSLARVFAAAINCHALPLFQQDPKLNPVPCLTCPSCIAMQRGNHPDFIEIDAASNTGVDHVRSIIEASALMPLMGRKKIYLIDEAHMLSKAAFNAFLKILEEPPASALFMLATTDPQKIIETVRSRCFQLCFKAVDMPNLVEHLRMLCSEEAIYADNDALGLIAQETKGSVRDAINLLEQIRFAQGRVTRDAILKVLGYVDDDRLVDLLQIVCRDNSQLLMRFLSETRLEQYSADYIWRRMVELVRMTIWASYGLSLFASAEQSDKLAALAKQCSHDRFTTFLDIFCSHERLFLKTTNKHLLLEMLLLKICKRNDPSNVPTMGSVPQQVAAQVIPDEESDELIEQDEEDEDNQEGDVIGELQEKRLPNTLNTTSTASSADQLWQSFIARVDQLSDPLLSSVFKHGSSVCFDRDQARIDVYFAKQFIFFNEWLESTKQLWQPLLYEVYAAQIAFVPHFTLEQEASLPNNPASTIAEPIAHVSVNQNIKTSAPNISSGASFGRYKKFNNKPSSITRKSVVDVSDVNSWPTANLLLRYFPGVIREG